MFRRCSTLTWDIKGHLILEKYLNKRGPWKKGKKTFSIQYLHTREGCFSKKSWVYWYLVAHPVGSYLPPPPSPPPPHMGCKSILRLPPSISPDFPGNSLSEERHCERKCLFRNTTHWPSQVSNLDLLTYSLVR